MGRKTYHCGDEKGLRSLVVVEGFFGDQSVVRGSLLRESLLLKEFQSSLQWLSVCGVFDTSKCAMAPRSGHLNSVKQATERLRG